MPVKARNIEKKTREHRLFTKQSTWSDVRESSNHVFKITIKYYWTLNVTKCVVMFINSSGLQFSIAWFVDQSNTSITSRAPCVRFWLKDSLLERDSFPKRKTLSLMFLSLILKIHRNDSISNDSESLFICCHRKFHALRTSTQHCTIKHWSKSF